MPRAAQLKPRKAPRQVRSQATVAAILAAAARVLRRESLAGFNTNRVAEVAGISVGSLYQYFPNKDALAAALLEQAQDELAAQVEATVAAVQGQPLAVALAALADVAVRQQYGDPVLAAALDHEERRLPLARRLAASTARIGGAVHGLLTRHLPGVPVDAARDCMALTRALVEAEAGDRNSPPADLQARIVRTLLGYLAPWQGTARP